MPLVAEHHQSGTELVVLFKAALCLAVRNAEDVIKKRECHYCLFACFAFIPAISHSNLEKSTAFVLRSRSVSFCPLSVRNDTDSAH